MKYPLFITQHGKLEREKGTLFFVGELAGEALPLAWISELKRKLGAVINEEEDSILFYSLPSDRVLRTFHLGKPPDRFENVI